MQLRRIFYLIIDLTSSVSSSSLRTTHWTGWGGNYFIFGGGLKGGRIIGNYPKSFGEDDETNIGRGRILPTRSWESIWHGIAQWFGVDSVEDMDYVIPNNQNFGCDLYSDSDLYKNGTSSVPGCGGGFVEYALSVGTTEPRYLTGEEQKAACGEWESISSWSLCSICDRF